MSKVLLGVDPGKRTGWALMEAGELACCGTVDGDDPTLMAAATGRVLDEVVVEVPRWRRYGNPGDPNDLLTLAKRAGRVIQHFVSEGCEVVEVFPEEWKGGVAKALSHRRIAAKLSPAELALFDAADHNGRDAVGIALWRCGRLPRGG